MLSQINLRQFALGTLAALAITSVFVVWGHLDSHSLLMWSLEDRPIENGQAICYGLASLGFVIVMFRSRFLKEKKTPLAYFFVFGLALIMFWFAGEEISWGQRLFGFETPESIASLNAQQEFNVHNLGIFDQWEYRLLSLFMFFVGVIFPALALLDKGKQWIQKLSFPVLPIAWSAFFVLSWLFGKIYFTILLRDTATEVRELLFAMGMLAFAWHGVLRPDDLFRVKRDGPEA